MSIKKILVIICVLGMMVLLLLYPQNSLQSARYGLDLWFRNVLPSLLPFVIASFILLEVGIVSLLSRFFAPLMRLLFAAPGESAYVLVVSALSGYPVGAKLVGELMERKQISEIGAQRTLRFTSVSGPVFITGAVCTGMLGIPEAGVYLAATHYISAVLVGVVFGLFCKRNIIRKERFSAKQSFLVFKKDVAKCKPFGEILATSVQKAVTTMLKVGGFIILFCVVIELLSATGIIDFFVSVFSPISQLFGISDDGAAAIIAGGIEMTSGSALGASLNIEMPQKLSLIAFIIAFGGLSVHMQTRAVCLSVKPKLFFLAKLVQAVFSYLLCALSLELFPITIAASSLQHGIKTAAYLGGIFAAVSIIILFIIKLVQKHSSAFASPGKL